MDKMIDEMKYFEEVEKLLSNEPTKVTKFDFQVLFNIVSEGQSDLKIDGIEVIEVDGPFIADKIVKGLFSTVYGNDAMVPWGFFDTEVGKAVAAAKFGLEKDVYFIQDLVALTGVSKQFLSKEIKNGNIKYRKRHGLYYFTQSDIDEYLKKKKLGTLEEKKKVLYENVREEINNPGFERDTEYK